MPVCFLRCDLAWKGHLSATDWALTGSLSGYKNVSLTFFPPTDQLRSIQRETISGGDSNRRRALEGMWSKKSSWFFSFIHRFYLKLRWLCVVRMHITVMAFSLIQALVILGNLLIHIPVNQHCRQHNQVPPTSGFTSNQDILNTSAYVNTSFTVWGLIICSCNRINHHWCVIFSFPKLYVWHFRRSVSRNNIINKATYSITWNRIKRNHACIYRQIQ